MEEFHEKKLLWLCMIYERYLEIREVLERRELERDEEWQRYRAHFQEGDDFFRQYGTSGWLDFIKRYESDLLDEAENLYGRFSETFRGENSCGEVYRKVVGVVLEKYDEQAYESCNEDEEESYHRKCWVRSKVCCLEFCKRRGLEKYFLERGVELEGLLVQTQDEYAQLNKKLGYTEYS